MISFSQINLFLFLSISYSVFADDIKYETKKPSVVIVGAGAAGISTASKLLENGGFDVSIIEAEDRYGGRIFNLFEEDYYKALGAEWTPANDKNIVYKMLHEKNAINEKWTPKPGIYVKSNGDALSFEQFLPYVDALNHSNDDLCNNITSEDEFYEKAFTKIPNNEFDETLGRNLPKFMNISIHFPCKWDKTGAHIEKPLVGDPKQPIRGMMSVLDVLMGKQLKTDGSDIWENVIKLRQRVTKINWNITRPEIYTLSTLDQSNDARLTADHVVVTIPLGVLKAEHLKLFDPQLPQKHQKVISTLRVGIENNIYLTFENRWWPTGYDLFVIWTKDDVQNLTKEDKWLSKIEGFVPVDDAPAVLAVHNMELADSSSENLSDLAVINRIMIVLRNAFGNKGWNITNPIRIDHSRWGTNPNFYGSVTYKDIEAYRSNVTNSDLREVIKNKEGKQVLFFAGEATHDRFPGSVHGAVESGFDVADKIIKIY